MTGTERRAILRHQAWAERRARAERGDVLIDYELSTIERFVEHYGMTFGHVRPWEVQGIMRPLIERYPDSPIADEAQRQIERSHEAMLQSGEYAEGWESMEQAADVMENTFGSPHREVSERACARGLMSEAAGANEFVPATEATEEHGRAGVQPDKAEPAEMPGASGSSTPPTSRRPVWLWVGGSVVVVLLGLGVVLGFKRRSAAIPPAARA